MDKMYEIAQQARYRFLVVDKLYKIGVEIYFSIELLKIFSKKKKKKKKEKDNWKNQWDSLFLECCNHFW